MATGFHPDGTRCDRSPALRVSSWTTSLLPRHRRNGLESRAQHAVGIYRTPQHQRAPRNPCHDRPEWRHVHQRGYLHFPRVHCARVRKLRRHRGKQRAPYRAVHRRARRRSLYRQTGQRQRARRLHRHVGPQQRLAESPTNPRSVPALRIWAGVDLNPPLGEPILLDGALSPRTGSPTSSITTTWSLVSGPGKVNFTTPGREDANATFSATGVYVRSLTATAPGFRTRPIKHAKAGCHPVDAHYDARPFYPPNPPP